MKNRATNASQDTNPTTILSHTNAFYTHNSDSCNQIIELIMWAFVIFPNYQFNVILIHKQKNNRDKCITNFAAYSSFQINASYFCKKESS